MKSTRANFIKIGVFVVLATALLVGAIIIEGSGAIFEEQFTAETYINESVQGLEKGSEVKYRGVKIGSVKTIDFVHNVYRHKADFSTDRTRYVLVRIRFNPDVFSEEQAANIPDVLQIELNRGMRIQLTHQGVTGIAYLEVDYIDPKQYPPMDIYWEPDYLYIPSAPSLYSNFAVSLEGILRMVEGMDLDALSHNVNELIAVLTRDIGDIDLANLSENAKSLLTEVRATNQSLQDYINREEFKNLPDDISALTASARRTMESSENQIADTLEQYQAVAERISSLTLQLETMVASQDLNTGIKNFSDSSANIKMASDDLPVTIARLNKTLQRLENILSGNQADIEATLENIRVISEHIKELSNEARRNPSHVLFGESPPAAKEVE